MLGVYIKVSPRVTLLVRLDSETKNSNGNNVGHG